MSTTSTPAAGEVAAVEGEVLSGRSPRPNRHGDGGGRPKRRLVPIWWAIPALVLVLAVHYAAIGSGAIYAFTDWTGIGSFKWVGLANFAEIFSSKATLLALRNTIVLAVLFLIVTNVLGLAFALVLNRTLKTRHVLRVLLFLPAVLSPLAVAYIWAFIFQEAGPLNGFLASVGLKSWVHTWLGDPTVALWTVLVVMVWQHIGLSMVMYLAGLAGVPPELEEAASIDGAGLVRRFTSVVLPQLRPAIVISCTLLLIRGMSIFDQVLALTNGGPYGATDTLATLVYKDTFVNSQYGLGTSLSLILTLITVCAALLQIVLLRRNED